MRPGIVVFAFVLSGLTLSATAQQPAPPELVVQAANSSAPVTTVKPAAVAADDSSLQTAIKALQEVKKANEDLLKKQETTLQQLDELQKTAEQLRIFSKRG